MRLQKVLYHFALLYLFSFTCYAQVKLELELLSESKDAINIRLTSTNTSSIDTLLFYKPTAESFCATVISIDFRQTGTNKEHAYYPCTEILDLDHILLHKSNSILIPPTDAYVFEISLKKKEISPYLIKGEYSMQASLYYGYGNFKSVLEPKYSIYRGTTTSNEVLIYNQ